MKKKTIMGLILSVSAVALLVGCKAATDEEEILIDQETEQRLAEEAEATDTAEADMSQEVEIGAPVANEAGDGVSEGNPGEEETDATTYEIFIDDSAASDGALSSTEDVAPDAPVSSDETTEVASPAE